MEHAFGEWRVRGIELCEHCFRDGQRVASCFRVEVSGCALQAFANLAHGGGIDFLAQLFFLPAAKFDQGIDELGLAPGLAGKFEAAQGGQLDIQIAHFAGAFTDPSESLQKLLLIAIEFGRKFAEQYLEAPRAGAKAVYALCRRLRRKLGQVPLKLLKNRTAALWSDGHNFKDATRRRKFRLVCESHPKASPF
jgi:hypothetical protein